MYKLKIPTKFRPGGYLKPCHIGIDLPAWFIDGIRELDSNIYPIYHPFKTLYEDFTTNYTGSEDDPRYAIHTSSETGEQEIWGWPLKERKDQLKRNDNWHLWRLCGEVGWAHIFEIESRDPDYLMTMLQELQFIAQMTNRYGHHAVADYKREKQIQERAKNLEDQKSLFKDVMTENKGIMRKVLENYSMGKISATNPTVERISSYNGQRNHSRIIRPLDDADKESGLVLPSKWLEH